MRRFPVVLLLRIHEAQRSELRWKELVSLHSPRISERRERTSWRHGIKKVCCWRGNARTRGACTEPVEVLGAAPRVGRDSKSRKVSDVVGVQGLPSMRQSSALPTQDKLLVPAAKGR